MADVKCADCGDDTEQVYEITLKPARSRKGKMLRWKGGICEECLQKRFDGMMSLRPL